MIHEINEWIQNIAVFLVVSSAVLHAVPGKDYHKYIRFFIGLILIVMLVEPIMNLAGTAEGFEKIYEDTVYKRNLQEMEEAEEFRDRIEMGEIEFEFGETE